MQDVTHPTPSLCIRMANCGRGLLRRTKAGPASSNDVNDQIADSRSVAKYVAEGLIDLKTVADYIPELAKVAGDQTLRAVWDMRDGAAYSEVYDDPSSTVAAPCASGWLELKDCPNGVMRSSYEFLPTVQRDEHIVGEFHYKPASTDVLASARTRHWEILCPASQRRSMAQLRRISGRHYC